jgi:iron-sulfur cluster assembly protein
MDCTADFAGEDVVDQLVLLNPTKALETFRYDLGTKVVASARGVLDSHVRPRQSLFDALPEFFCAWHMVSAPGRRLLSQMCGRDAARGISRVPTRTPIQSRQMVKLTDIAAEKVQEFMSGQGAEGEVGLRVGVKGGGCSGFQYALALDGKRDDDHVFEISGIRVLVDPASMQYVDGSTVDFTESFMGSGFEVSNPNVVASCGCGSSFRVAEEEPSCGASV